MGRVWKQLQIEATNCTDDTCTFMLGCDCSTKRIQKNMRSQISAAATNSSKGGAKGPTRFKECAELFAELDKYITSKHAKRQACTLIKRSADWLSEAADKKAKTDVSENLSKEADRIKQRERKIQSLEKSLDNRIDEAEVTRRKEMPIDPTNHEGFDYPTVEGVVLFCFVLFVLQLSVLPQWASATTAGPFLMWGFRVTAEETRCCIAT